MDRVDCVVVGAGVVGLAIARALARLGREVIVLEREGLIGGHTSSRNSEVIHAGIYYPRGSAKARMCVRGKALLYEYCEGRGVPHRRLGKIIVATEDGQAAQLEGIKAAAAGNGVEDLSLLDRADLARLEPELRGVAGLLSPSTGILDSHAFMLSLLAEVEDAGGAVAFHARLAAARPVAAGFEIAVESGPETPRTGTPRPETPRPETPRPETPRPETLRPETLRMETLRMETGLLINAAGLFAGEVAAAIEGLAPAHRRRVHYCKGTYFSAAGFSAGGRAPFRHLIYPVPERDGLGVHLTLDMAGQGRFGPDTEWVEGIDYGLDPGRGAGFYAAIRRYWPGLPDGALEPSYTGIRPKLYPEGGPATDFVIEGPETHGLAGLVNLFGIESPGLTAALAIAEEVAARAGPP